MGARACLALIASRSCHLAPSAPSGSTADAIMAAALLRLSGMFSQSARYVANGTKPGILLDPSIGSFMTKL
eukprot:1877839-Pleurochrysis_carterae.AAC.2